MEWLNVFGLVFMVLIMVPNIVFAVKCKEGFQNIWHNKTVEVLEQIGRFSCMGFMIFQIPGMGVGFSSDNVFAVYLIANLVFIGCYYAIWIFCFRKNTVFRALALSVIPAVVFLFSGFMSHSILLIIAAVIFAPCHILISYKNVEG